MRRMYTLMALVAGVAMAAPVAAQERTEGSRDAELRAMVTDGTTADADRATVRAFLNRPEVATAAQAHGLSLEDARNRVATMDDASLADLAERMRTMDDQPDQVGGDTFVISSTAVIIALLVIILVVVA